MSWRSEARKALREYPRAKRRQADAESIRITPAYSGMPGCGSASRTTETVALRSSITPHEENVISAVEFMMRMQCSYPNAEQRMRMLNLVYFKRTHTLEGAAVECNCSERTIKRWNNEAQTAVYVALHRP